MANQIGKFFVSQGADKAVPGIAEHIRKFWDPRMRKAIIAHLDAGGDGLDPPVRDAMRGLKSSFRGGPARPRRHPRYEGMRLSVAAPYFTPSSSTSNISVAFGGITPPAPRAP